MFDLKELIIALLIIYKQLLLFCLFLFAGCLSLSLYVLSHASWCIGICFLSSSALCWTVTVSHSGSFYVVLQFHCVMANLMCSIVCNTCAHMTVYASPCHNHCCHYHCEVWA